MSDTTKAIEELTGINEHDQLDIIEQVRANLKRLAECKGGGGSAGHDFTICIDRHTKQPTEKPTFACKWRCKHCGGEIDGQSRVWFERGREQGYKEGQENARLWP